MITIPSVFESFWFHEEEYYTLIFEDESKIYNVILNSINQIKSKSRNGVEINKKYIWRSFNAFDKYLATLNSNRNRI